MAYHLFSKQQRSKGPMPQSLSPPQTTFNTRPNIPPSHPPPRAPLKPPTSETTKLKQPTSSDPSFQPEPFPDLIESGYQTPHPNITIETVGTAHIPSLTRITGLLLPIRYPNSFYTSIITDPVIASLSRVAIYHDHPVSTVPPSTSLPVSSNMGTDKVIGGIRCRLERLPATTTELLNSQSKSHQDPANLYIQTLHLLSPYRGRGVAASLLNSLVFSTPPRPELKGGEYQVSDLVKHYNIRTVTAHVHEANEDALQWYISRGFIVQDGVVENYYRRLKPSGARIVKFVLDWNDRDAGDVPHASSMTNDQGNESRAEGDREDDDWEKVEPEEADELYHGVQPLSGSRILEGEEGGRKKRKMDDC